MINIFIASILLLVSPGTFDEPRDFFSFNSANLKFELKVISPLYTHPFVWGLIERSSGKKLYEITGEYSARTIFVSDDGRNLVMIDDFSERAAQKSLDVLLFFRDGVKVKEYSLGDLLRDPSNISHSVSHFQWLLNNIRQAISNDRLVLETFELVHYEFDIRTGEMLSKKLDPIIGPDTFYVYGYVEKTGIDQYKITVSQRVYGEVPASGTIYFQADPKEMPTDPRGRPRYLIVVIDNGKLVALKDYIHNQFKYSQKKSKP